MGAAAEQPTPADWEQWQPQTDSSDTRLDRTFVSVWEEQITAEELLSRLSGQSSVELSAIEYLGPIRVTVFAEGCTLAGMMSSLAHLFEGYWVFRRGEEPERRAYVLTEHEAETLGFYEWVRQYVREDRRAFAATHQQELRERLALYREALGLTPEEVLARYEETDPWLCAEVLDPRARPSIEMVCSLDEGHMKRLIETGRTGMRVSALEPALQSYFGEWWKNGMPSAAGSGGVMMTPDPGPDYLPRFATEEERWENATVAVWWYGDSVGGALCVPDGPEYHTQPITVETDKAYSPHLARWGLAQLGYREATPEYLERAEKEGRAWQEAEEQRQAHPSEEELRYAGLMPAPNRTDPRLKIEVDLSSLEGTRLATGDVLEQAARQCEVAVLANYLPPEQCWLPRGRLVVGEEGDGQTSTLGALLNGIRGRRGGGWTWNFYGRYLVARDGEYRLLEASVLPPGLIEELKDKLRPGSSISLEELARLTSGLNERQIVLASRHVPQLGFLPAHEARFYGQLTSDERAKLGEPGGLSVAELPRDWRYMYLERARRSRPWLGPEDMANATVRGIRRTLSSGGEGISMVIEYHFPDSPADRDVVFTSPLEVRVPPA
jgi:hypothetical protein